MNRQIALMLAIMCLGLVAFELYSTARRHREQGPLSGPDVLDRAARLSQSFVPEAGVLRLTPTFLQAPGAGGRRVRMWVVDCTSPAEEPVAHFAWDAGTGQLVQASRYFDGSRLPSVSDAATRNQGLRGAIVGLRSLDVDGRARSWRLVAQPTPWTTHWESDDCDAAVHASGESAKVSVQFVPRGPSARKGIPAGRV